MCFALCLIVAFVTRALFGFYCHVCDLSAFLCVCLIGLQTARFPLCLIVSLVTSVLSFVLDCFFGDLCAFFCVDNRMTHALSFVLDCYVSDLRAFLCVWLFVFMK